MRRFTTNDATTEALRDILEHNPDGIGIIHDELSQFIGGFDAYRGRGGKIDRARHCRLWNGGEEIFDRVGKPEIVVPNWSATVFGCIPTETAHKCMQEDLADGLMQRFLFAHCTFEEEAPDRLQFEPFH
jgi:hypothetical protein